MSEGGEKTLPPSAKKLRDAREKGQLAKSKDVIALVGFVAAAGTLFVTARSLGTLLTKLTAETLAFSDKPFEQRAAELAVEWLQVAILIVGPAIAAAVVGIILGSIIVMRGFVFTLHPMSMGLQKLNPVTNLKQTFGLHALVELVKSILKVVTLAAVFGLVIKGALGAIFLSAYCGVECQLLLVNRLAVLILVIGAFVLLVLAVGDVLVQRWLFMRDMRMSVEEAKREHKEQDGDPEIKREQNRLRRDTVTGSPVGSKNATVLVVGGGHVVGIRFVPNETPVPVVVYRGNGPAGASVVAGAKELGIKVHSDADLAATLAAEGKMGQFIPRSTFGPIALMLHRLSGR